MGKKKMMGISLTLAALLVASWALPAAATDYAASNYLPLAVGNSWTYGHSVVGLTPYDEDKSHWPTYTAQFPKRPQFTITVERTEVIDSKTYFVISDMPDHWPPAPPHFIAGKKLRWEGTRLMERTPDGEHAIFRFDGTASEYGASTDPPLGRDGERVRDGIRDPDGRGGQSSQGVGGMGTGAMVFVHVLGQR